MCKYVLHVLQRRLSYKAKALYQTAFNKYTIRSIICEPQQTDEKHKDLWYASQKNRSVKQIRIKIVFMGLQKLLLTQNGGMKILC